MESVPVSGVVMRKERVAGRLTPFCRNAMATGTTAQLQMGMGTLNAAEVVTLFKPAAPINL